jgi:hypothetical protein
MPVDKPYPSLGLFVELFMESTEAFESLGERIVQAARMAVAIHLQTVDSPEIQPKRMLRPGIEDRPSRSSDVQRLSSRWFGHG